MTVEAARVSTQVAAPPGKVWSALTDLKTLKTFFFGADIETDWRVGSPIYWRGEWNGKRFEDKGEIKAFVPDKKLSMTHFSPLSGMPDKPENYHIVTFELAPSAKGTNVTLTQQNQNPAEKLTPENRKEFTKNWTMVLDGLKRAAEEGNAKPKAVEVRDRV